LLGVLCPINSDFGGRAHTSRQIIISGRSDVPNHIPAKSTPKKTKKTKEEKIEIMRAERQRKRRRLQGLTARSINERSVEDVTTEES
jgi:hypothetical protein